MSGLFLAMRSEAQIVDDTTRLIYGPKTTLYIYEDDILNNRPAFHPADTSLDNFHNYRHLYQTDKHVYQDLGQLGTPLNIIYYNRPQQLGRQLGFDAYTPYSIIPEHVKYYDTRSPFTELNYVQGGEGQQILSAAHTRNINPRWNMGFKINRMTALRPFGQLNRTHSLTNHWSFLLHNRYVSENGKYQLLANASLMDHSNNETGGIFPRPVQTDLFNYRIERPYLHSAVSVNQRRQLHLYQEYQIDTNRLQVFAITDVKNIRNRFRNDFVSMPERPFNVPATFGYDTVFYTRPPFSDTLGGSFMPLFRDQTYDQTILNLLENNFGVKGEIEDTYYRFFYRRRDFSYHQPGLNDIEWYSENFAGALLRRKIAEKTYVSTEGMINPGRDYLYKADFNSENISLGINGMRYSPDLLHTSYESNHFRWTNSFDLSNLREVYGSVNLKKGIIAINMKGTYQTINNYIYYNSQAVPEQANSAVNFLIGDLDASIHWKFLHFENFFRYAHRSGADVLRVPRIFNHARLYFQGMLFRNALEGQIGVDVYYRDLYQGDRYMPVTQQFYLNEPQAGDFVHGRLTGGYPIANLFLNARIKTVRVFAQLTHVNQYLFGEGYFITPYYTDLPRTFVFGLNWMFYD